MRVKFSTMKNGDFADIGELVWDGKEFSFSPPNQRVLDSIMARPVIAPTGYYSAKADPVGFMQNLMYAYRSPYCCAGRAVET
ncbi:hypothetical protein AYO40_01075 [Planctomycetaceae bacterium SCGC AG-212-D15]|nr:hypothetical protein AYO40_01075 [Planctomycetaceae bacterium SCGC AG-212-D15]